LLIVSITYTSPTSLLGANGTLSLSISNGTPDYAYLLTWQNETVAAFGTSSSGEVTITGLKEGRYRLSVTDEDESTTSFYSDNVRIYTPFVINKDGTVAFDTEGNLIFNN